MRLPLFFFLFPFIAISQVELSGIVRDSIDVIEFANVVLMDSNNNNIDGTITDISGRFKMSVKKNHYKLKVSFMGYKDTILNVDITDYTDVGSITIEYENSELDEVVVSARKKIIERKVDRIVFNVENSIVSNGGSAMDALQKTPGVRIDGENIGLIGKSTIKVLVNGRISPLSGEDLSNYLRSISSDDIARIEVITNPPAKYEAEGNSGLINIILKNIKKDYFSGNIRSTYKQATYPSSFLGGGVTYQKDKLSLFANINSGNGSVAVNETNKIFYPIQNWDTQSQIRYFTKFVSGRAGIDYDISDKTSIGVQYLGSASRPNNEEKTSTNIFNTNNSLDSLLLTIASSDKKVFYHSVNGHFKTVFDTIGKSMTIDIDYLVYKNNLDRTNSTNSFLPNGDIIENSNQIFRNTSNQDVKSFTTGVDFEWPIQFSNIEFGGKLSYIENNSDVGAYEFQNDSFVVNSDQSNIFEYKESTQSMYVSSDKSLGKWDFKIGLRTEFSQTQGNSITLNQTNKNNYSKLFPTVYVNYNSSKVHTWSFNYGKRINRPNYSSLNPFRWFSNPYSYTEGNPFLEPSFVDNFELSHLYNNNLNTSLYFFITENGSDQITLTDPNTNIQATIRQNFLNEYAFGIAQSFTLKKIHWIESYLQYDLSYAKIKSSLPNTINEQIGVNFYASIDNSFYFNTDKTILGEFNFWYSAPAVSGVDKITESYAVDAGLKWLLFDKKLQINFILTDVFRTNISTIKSVVNDIRQEYRNYYDSRQLRISATYQFGNNNLRNKQKKFSNEEERNRTD